MPLSPWAAFGPSLPRLWPMASDDVLSRATPLPVTRRGLLRPRLTKWAHVPARTGVGLLAAVGIGLLLGACGSNDGKGEAQRGEAALSPGAQPLPEGVQALVNQGNEAHRGGRYPEALAFYREAMAGAPGHPVPQFGALMAALALGDSALADSLQVQLKTTAPELLDMLHPGGSMGPRTSLPPGHPPVQNPRGEERL